jgi:hypothetical protein
MSHTGFDFFNIGYANSLLCVFETSVIGSASRRLI